MHKPLFILLGGLLGGAAMLCLVYLARTHETRQLLQKPEVELLWLKQEFGLNDQEYQRITDLHRQYLPECIARCDSIQKISDEIQERVQTSSTVSPEVEKLFLDRSRIMGECQLAMLRHFQAVSREMPREQRRRYLAWVEEATCLNTSAGNMSPGSHTGQAMEMQ